jgi:hypothetical protein
MTNLEFSNAGQYGSVIDGKLYGPQGGLTGHRELQGFSAVRKQQSAVHRKRVAEAARLYSDVLNGEIDPYFIRQAMNPTDEFAVQEIARRYPGIYGNRAGSFGLRETMSVTDFQPLFVDVIDRQYYGYYQEFPIVNKSLVKVHKLRDFRQVSRYLLDGVVSPLVAMDPAAPPPQRSLTGPVPQDGASAAVATTAPIQYSPLLYQAMTSVNWRAFVNDDLEIFKDLSRRLAMSGNMGISKFITSQYVSSTGPNPALYQAGYRNLITTAYGAASNNPPLSSQGIMDALKILASMRDSSGNPIYVGGLKPRLWYGPSYTAVAENLMNATRIMVQNEGGTGNAQGFPTQFVETANWLIRNMELVMDPWIPLVCTTAGTQNTMWGITLDPESAPRPAIEVGFLQGFEEPQIFQKVSNTQRLGGGVDPMLGDFNTMDSDMKIVTVMGGTPIDGRTTVASTGQGV